MRLILFDIDGTLINSSRAGRAAMGRALQDVFGTPGAVHTCSFAGKTDRGIVNELMVAEGFAEDEIEARLPQFYKRMDAAGRDLFTPERIRPCPGVFPLLETLKNRQDVMLALLTGNIRCTVPLKLAAAGIDPEQFRLGAYGSDSAVRNDLFSIAIERAETILGHSLSPRDTIIIGDTPGDIVCARAGGGQVVAVATGPFTLDALRVHEPDYLFGDLSQTEDVLTAIFNSGPLTG